ncbi:MAG: phage integrase N-terminal SAM-like domain-containing protein [Armatimonadetes bacterium]|nr:phage integrase N-terminal SAM-like domain-containing protein [Armatimonadota bacterium]
MPTESLSQFLEHVRAVIRLKHFSRTTEEVYLSRIRQFIQFHGRRYPNTLTAEHIRAYLTPGRRRRRGRLHPERRRQRTPVPLPGRA